MQVLAALAQVKKECGIYRIYQCWRATQPPGAQASTYKLVRAKEP